MKKCDKKCPAYHKRPAYCVFGFMGTRHTSSEDGGSETTICMATVRELRYHLKLALKEVSIAEKTQKFLGK
jgi:hypothetical protein